MIKIKALLSVLGSFRSPPLDWIVLCLLGPSAGLAKFRYYSSIPAINSSPMLTSLIACQSLSKLW